ncbi:hypothetical protein PR048_006549 [Dryococelus australis]|uniref:Uncharacterized protein n=1 Tax=Dryococelus australis TaxID=614101 RepID=A0ABQ9IDI4_9NEOP|nr:hypothetical protein PR048_006549 [Dryococelus australis]
MDEIHPTYSYKKEGSQRSPNAAYRFVVDGHRIHVCKNFFTKTMDIITGVIEEDFRAKHKNQKEIAETFVQDITDHINSFPRIYSQYCRKGIDRDFIDEGLDIWQMYRLYVEECQAEPSKLVALKHNFFPPKERSVITMYFIRKQFTRRKIQLQQKYDDHPKKKSFQRKLRRTTLQQEGKNHL